MSTEASVPELFQFGETAASILIDVATFSHLAGMAAGCGAVIFTDSLILRRISQPATAHQIAVVHHAHTVISIALGVLWVSGLVLLGIRTGFDPGLMTPKLIAKLGTVTVLTVTAVAMARIALPLIDDSVGRRLLDAPLGQQCQLALCVGMSAAGWGTALMLGASKILKTAGDEVWMLCAAMHGLAAAGAVALAIVIFAVRQDAARLDGLSRLPA
jgi:hypothetical protein